jgi:hypothetical protein
MIISINQPAYIPWLGYFHRIAQSELHIVLDHVQFEKNSFTNRNKVRTNSGWCWITVPVHTKNKFGELPINDVKINNSTNWKKKHFQTILQNYNQSPYFNLYREEIESLFTGEWTNLSTLCDKLTTSILRWLDINTPMVRSSELTPTRNKSSLVLELCEKTGATTYLSGPFGRDYLDQNTFSDKGISISFHEYEHPTYAQTHDGAFQPFMFIFDLLFNYGPDSWRILGLGEGRQN